MVWSERELTQRRERGARCEVFTAWCVRNEGSLIRNLVPHIRARISGVAGWHPRKAAPPANANGQAVRDWAQRSFAGFRRERLW